MEIGHQEALWPGCMAHSYKRIFKDRINRTEGGFMLGNVRKKFIGDKQFYKMVLAIAIPIMIQNGITNFVSLLDNIMVGQIGTEQMSGVAIVNQLIFVYNLCIFGGVSGAGIFTAQYFGQKDDEGIRHTFRFKLWVSAILTALVIVIFIIGGESIYRMMLPYCDTAYVTRTDFAYDADTYFPDLDEMPEWKLVKESEEETYFDIEYQFLVYQK